MVRSSWILGIKELSRLYRKARALFEKMLRIGFPEFIRELLGEEPKKPDWLVDGPVYEPIVKTHNQWIKVPPRSIFGYGYPIERFAKSLEGLSVEEKLNKIWEFVITKIRYTYDEWEEFYPAEWTLAFGAGDCEDTSILFVALCRAAKIPADRVFCVMGYFDRYGHAFPIAKRDDGKWYVYESTLSRVPKEPILFKGSRYTSPSSGGIGGMYNWKWKGVIRGGKSQI